MALYSWFLDRILTGLKMGFKRDQLYLIMRMWRFYPLLSFKRKNVQELLIFFILDLHRHTILAGLKNGCHCLEHLSPNK